MSIANPAAPPRSAFLARPTPGKVAPAAAAAQATRQAAAPGASPFRAVLAARPNTPPRVVMLDPSAWASTYSDRKTEPVRIGLRLYSEGAAVQARASAAQRAWKLHPQEADEDLRIEAYNATLMAWLVAHATCDPEDLTLPFFGTERGGAEDIVPLALTPKAIEFLFEELDALVTEETPTSPEAVDEDLAWLADALRTGQAWGRLPAATTRHLRRLLSGVISIMRGEAG